MAYVPTGMNTTSTGMANIRATYYSDRGLDRLQATTPFREACTKDMVPKRNGKTIQWFRYNNLSSVTSPTADGTVPTSQTISNNIVAGDLSQYSAFISMSTFLQDIALDPVIENASDLLGYQAGLSVNEITRSVIDAYNASVTVSLNGTYPTAEDIRGGVSRLQGANILPHSDNDYLFICHPYSWFDIINDPAANGYADLFKYTTAKSDTVTGFNPRARTVANFAGVRVVTTTTVNMTASGSNLYRAYLFGYNGLGCAALEGSSPSEVFDPNSQKFKINVLSGGKPTLFDPTGEIGGMVSYRFTYLAVALDGPSGIGGNYRWRTFECPTKLGL